MKPTPHLLLLFLVALVTAVLPVFLGPRLVSIWLVTVATLFLLGGLDAILALPPRRLGVTLQVPPRIPIGERDEATLALRARSRFRHTRIRVAAETEGGIEPLGIRVFGLADGGAVDAALPLVPTRRGRTRIRRIWLDWTGPLGLVRRRKRVPVEAETAIVPNVGVSRSRALRLFRRQETWIGLKAIRHVGEGSEFESLREYVPGLDSRSMNWKASARHRQLISTEYRDERNHQIVVALDTGHLMQGPVQGIPKLDHAATAAMVLAYAGLRHGDRVGAFAFDQEVKQWVEPRGGLRSLARLQQFAAEVEYTTAETNYTLGLAELSARLHRRSFVVVFTDFVDTVTAELMIENAGRLAAKHLVTFVTFRDRFLRDRIDRVPYELGDVYGAIVAYDFARERELVLHRLRRMGIFCIDADVQDVSTDLINRYLDVKRRELVG